MTYWERLEQVIDYLNGKVDIYDGQHNDTVKAWNSAWDEMVWQGFKPDSVVGIKQYIAANR